MFFRYFIILISLTISACSTEQKIAQAPKTALKPSISEVSQVQQTPLATATTNNHHIKPITSVRVWQESLDNSAIRHIKIRDNTRNFEKTKKTKPSYPQNTWDKITSEFEFYHQYRHHPIVSHYVYKTLSKPYLLNTMLKNSARYIDFVYGELNKRNMPSELALLPFVESLYKPTAKSHKGAAGLWQFTRSTGKHYGLQQNWWFDARLDVYQSTIAALNYLQDLHYKYQNWSTALAAYNYGMGNIDRLIKMNQRKNLPTDYWSLNLPKETREYVPKLIAYCYLLKHAEKYQLTLKQPQLQGELVRVPLSQVTSVKILAKASGMSVGEFKRFNPGFLRWIPKPKSNYAILLPQDKQVTFNRHITRLMQEEPIVWGIHRVKAGENLYNIARYYGIKLRALIRANRFGNKRIIRPGDKLVIPSHTTARIQAKKRYLRSYHKVKSGDTLYALAKKYKIHIGKLLSANNLTKNTIIRPGQSLRIPKK